MLTLSGAFCLSSAANFFFPRGTVHITNLLLACVASVSVGFRSKELAREKRGGRKSFLSPSPSFIFWLSPQFRAGKIPFLGLSLLANPTETLATQANLLHAVCFPALCTSGTFLHAWHACLAKFQAF